MDRRIVKMESVRISETSKPVKTISRTYRAFNYVFDLPNY